MSKNSVRTYNPENGLGWTSRNKADEMVKRDVARWKGKVCHLILNDYRAISIVATRKSHSNGVGFATLQGLAGTPVVANPIRLLTGKRPTESPRDWPDPVVISRRMLPLDGSAA